MKLSSEELDHLAKLSRLDIPPAEREKFREQIAAVLGYVASLQGIDVAGVDPTFRGTDLGQRLRRDVAEPCEADVCRALLDAVPERTGDYVRAQAALKHKQG